MNGRHALCILLLLASTALISACGGGEKSNTDTGQNNTTDVTGGDATNNTTNNTTTNNTTVNNTTNNTTVNNTTVNNTTNNTTVNNTTVNNTTVNNTTTNNTTPGCSHTGFEVARESAAIEQFGMQYVALDASGTPFDALRVQIYTAWDGPTQPGTYSLDGINYADCGLCVLVYDDCDETDCNKIFYAEQGTVEIFSLGGLGDQFSATLADVVFDEVTINDSYVSTPVPGGETWCVTDFSFDEEIEDISAAACEGETVNCVGEIIPDFSLQNCATGEMVSMYSLAEGQKAIWYVLTAGWCPACREWIPEVVGIDDQYGAMGLEVVYILGENQYENQPTLEYCQQYASDYTEDTSRFYIDHDGQYSFSTTFENMWPYLDEYGAFGLPWNALMNAATYNYEYADGAGGVEDLNDVLTRLMN